MLNNPNEWHNIENESKGVEEKITKGDVQDSETFGMPKNNKVKKTGILALILLILVSASIYKVNANAFDKNANLAESFFDPESPLIEEKQIETKTETKGNNTSLADSFFNKKNQKPKEAATGQNQKKDTKAENKPNIISNIESFFSKKTTANKENEKEVEVVINIEVEEDKEAKSNNSPTTTESLPAKTAAPTKKEENNTKITETFFEPEEIVVIEEEKTVPLKSEAKIEKKEAPVKLVNKVPKEEIKKNNNIDAMIKSFLAKLGITDKKKTETIVKSDTKKETKTLQSSKPDSLEAKNIKKKITNKSKKEPKKLKVEHIASEEPTVVIEVDLSDDLKADEPNKIVKNTEQTKEPVVENKIVTVKIGEVGRENPFKPSIKSDIGFDIMTPPTSAAGDATASRLMETTISGIMYDDKRPSAIININGEDQLVREGDKVLGCLVLDITKEKVVVKSGTNIYRAAVGQSIATDAVHINQVANLKSKFAGANNPNIKSIEIKPN